MFDCNASKPATQNSSSAHLAVSDLQHKNDLLKVPVHSSTDYQELDEDEMERLRRYSESEPLLPEAIHLIQTELHKYDKFSLPHVFVVFGASVHSNIVLNFKNSLPGRSGEKEDFPDTLVCDIVSILSSKTTSRWLYRDGLLPEQILFIGYARTNLSLEQLRKNFEKNCKVRENETEKFEDFIKRITYISGQYDRNEGFLRLKSLMDTMEDKLKSRCFLTVLIV